MSATSQALASRTSEQAASVEETTSSLEQMNASIAQNADNQPLHEQIAGQAAADADESGKATREAMAAMRAIVDKIAIIEETPTQTNLLALNAAIEAARAGEARVAASRSSRRGEEARGADRAASKRSAFSPSRASASPEKARRRLLEMVPSIKRTAELVQALRPHAASKRRGLCEISKR